MDFFGTEAQNKSEQIGEICCPFCRSKIQTRGDFVVVDRKEFERMKAAAEWADNHCKTPFHLHAPARSV